MIALPTPKWDRCEPINVALCCAGSVVRWAALVALTLTLLAFAVPVKAHACSGEDNYAPPLVAQSAAQFNAKQRAVVASVVKVTVASTDYREEPDRRHDVAGMGCCSACTSALMVASWTAAQGIVLYGDWLPPETRLSPIGYGAQFRPPRVIS